VKDKLEAAAAVLELREDFVDDSACEAIELECKGAIPVGELDALGLVAGSQSEGTPGTPGTPGAAARAVFDVHGNVISHIRFSN
jgi:hypothetical protein